MSSISPILVVKNLTKRYFGRKKPAIENISFNVYPGEFHVFIGANGAGKTTTIKSIIGAYYNWTGTITINKLSNKLESAKKHLGYIPENAKFPEKISALKYLQWMMMLSGVERHAAKKLAHDELKKIHMLNLKNKSPNTFSSGQKKKILLAQALINKPNLLIMDEPVANLDPEARMEFFGLLTSLKQEGKAILISSHVLSELDLYFDSATIIDGGKIVFSGTKLELLKRLGKANYLIHSTNDTLIKKFCSTHHISHTDLNDALVINTNNLPFLTKLQAYLAKQHVTILQFSLNKISLEQVYKKMVLKGSVDTM